MPARKKLKPIYQTAFLSFTILVFFATFSSLLNFQNKIPKQVVRDNLDAQREKWQSIIKEQPTFRDAYIILSTIEKEQGNLDASRTLMLEAKRVDPFYEVNTQASSVFSGSL